MAVAVVPLAELIKPAPPIRVGQAEYPILSMTMRDGLVDQGNKFKKRVAGADLSAYKVVSAGQLVVGFPIDEGVLSFQRLYPKAIVSPAYSVWDVADPDAVDPTYLENFLRSPIALRYYVSKMRGTTARRRNLPTDLFLELGVPLPDVGKQGHIVHVLDRVDELRAKRREALDLLDELEQQIFLRLFGKAAGGNRWDRVSVGSCAEVQGGLQVSAARRTNPKEVPYLRVANVYRGRLDLAEIKYLRATDTEIARTLLREGDLLVVEGHGNAAEIGRAAVWDGSISGCVHQNHLIRIRFDVAKVSPVFACSYLNSPEGRRHLLRAARTTSGLNTISVSDVRSTPILLPSRELQESYEQKLAEARKLKQPYQASLAELDELFASVQDRAFRGEL